MENLNMLWKLVGRYRYVITVLVLLFIIGVMDENCWIRRLGYQHEIMQLEEEIDEYRKQFEADTKRLNELKVDSCSIEQIARERYLMKKPNEDVFIFD